METARRRLLALTTAALFLIALSGCAAEADRGTAASDRAPLTSRGSTATTSALGEEPVTLVLANPLMDMPPQLVDWAVEVRHATDETIALDVRSSFGAQAGYSGAEQAVLDAVSSGEADLGWVGARALPAFEPLLAPMLVDSHDLQERLFERGVPQRMLAEIDVDGVTGVAVLPGPLRRMLGVSRDFRAPEDFAGTTIMSDLVGPAPETMEVLGAEDLVAGAEGLDIAELDGIQAHVGAVVGNDYQRIARSFNANLNLWPRPLVVIANEDALARLSTEHRDALLGAAERAFPTVLDTTRQEDLLPESQRAALCGSGLELIELSPEELSVMAEAVRPVRERIATDGGAGYLDDIDRLKEEVAAAPDVFRCP